MKLCQQANNIDLLLLKLFLREVKLFNKEQFKDCHVFIDSQLQLCALELIQSVTDSQITKIHDNIKYQIESTLHIMDISHI